MSVSSMRISELRQLLSDFESAYAESIDSIAAKIVSTLQSGGKILICGNGGSAADAQHFATEFMNSFSQDLVRPGLSAIALTTDTSFITAHANDFQFKTIFSRQVEALAREGDVLIAITTSGKSENCLAAVRYANQMGISTISFTKQGGEIAQLTENALEIRSDNTQHIQELHLISYHIIVEIVESKLYR
jgi:D-sedoheptulose 7-phosphate isomerase